MLLLKTALGISFLFSLWLIGFKHMQRQVCHSTNSHMLIYHHIQNKFEKLSSLEKLSFQAFLIKQGCLGLYRRASKDSYKFYSLKSAPIKLEMQLSGEL